MYKNRIRRTTPNSHPQFFIRHDEIAFDDRLPFIESVLETLLESRFGPDSVYQCVSRSSDRPELVPAVFSDLLDEEPSGLVPCDALSTLGRAGYQIVEAAYRRAKQMGLVVAASHGSSLTAACPANQGRGSPLE